MGPYESPTFLGRKDKIALGMTMGQLMKGVVLLLGLLTFWLVLLDHVGLIMSGLGFIVSLIGAVLLLTVKIGGVRIPAYLMKMLMMTIRRPAYVADSFLALQVVEPLLGSAVPGVAPESDEAVPTPGRLRGLLSLGRLKAVSASRDPNNRYMAGAQMDSVQVNVVVQVRRQLRSLLNEFRALLPKFRR